MRLLLLRLKSLASLDLLLPLRGVPRLRYGRQRRREEREIVQERKKMESDLSFFQDILLFVKKKVTGMQRFLRGALEKDRWELPGLHSKTLSFSSSLLFCVVRFLSCLHCLRKDFFLVNLLLLSSPPYAPRKFSSSYRAAAVSSLELVAR